MARWSPLAMPLAQRNYVAGLRHAGQRTITLTNAVRNGNVALDPDDLARHQDLVSQLADIADSAEIAELLWVTATMGDYVADAARHIPDTWRPADIVTEPHGIITWERPAVDVPFIHHAHPKRSEWPMPLNAVHWRAGGGGLRLHLLTFTSNVPRDLISERESRWFFTEGAELLLSPFAQVSQSARNLPDYAKQVIDLVGATWIIAAQETIATVSHEWADPDPNRAGRPPRPTPDVKVIDLRRRRYGQRERTGPPRHVEHDHRWEVGHHWRTQHHGPGNSLTKLVFIDDYVQGPEDAPLISRPTVKRLAR